MKEGKGKVAAIHDLSGYGRASLTVAIPVLASLGLQVCPLPTALLSTQTSGFTDYHYRDLTDDMYAILKHWQSLGLTFEGIYSGFLGSERQIACVSEVMLRCSREGTLLVVDPVLGDNGEPYGPISEELISGMKHLIGLSDVITPNFTEAALLLDEPFRATIEQPVIFQWLERLHKKGPDRVVITSVPIDGHPEQNFVYAYQGSSQSVYRLRTPHRPVCYAGAGDMFASILTGFLLLGESFPRALEHSVSGVRLAIEQAREEQVSEREGVLIEPVLHRLTAEAPSVACETMEGI